MWLIELYKFYCNYINVYVIKIILGELGISCDLSLTVLCRIMLLSMVFWGGCNVSSV